MVIQLRPLGFHISSLLGSILLIPVPLTASEHPRCVEARAGSSMSYGSWRHGASGLHRCVCPFSFHRAGLGGPGFLLLLLHSQFLPQIWARKRIRIKSLLWVTGWGKGSSRRTLGKRKEVPGGKFQVETLNEVKPSRQTLPGKPVKLRDFSFE